MIWQFGNGVGTVPLSNRCRLTMHRIGEALRMEIGHYMTGIDAPGGVAAYIRRVVAAQRRRGDHVALFDRGGVSTAEIYRTRDDQDLFETAARSGVSVIHLHTAIEAAPPKTVALVRTVHGHRPYCPSGSRFFGRESEPCPRAFSVAGCTWGHFVDRCGSVRPAGFFEDFQQTRWERQLLNKIPVIAISDFVRDQMVRSGYRADNISTILHPVTVPAASSIVPQRESPRFVFLGRLVDSKGIFWLLRAVAMVKSNVQIDIAGHGPTENKARELAAKLGIADRVQFHGWLDEAAAFRLIASARAVVFPSVWHEPAGLVTLEAAAHGRAVIASRVGGIPQYGAALGNTILADVNDAPGLASQIDRLAGDPALADQLGAAGRANALQHFTMEEHLDKLDHIYLRAQQGSRAGGV